MMNPTKIDLASDFVHLAYPMVSNDAKLGSFD